MTVEEFLRDYPVPNALNKAEYAIERIMRGSQTAVGALLCVHQVSMARRESERYKQVPTREACLALLALPVLD